MHTLGCCLSDEYFKLFSVQEVSSMYFHLIKIFFYFFFN